MHKRAITATGVAVAGIGIVALAAAPASAAWTATAEWERSCGTTYYARAKPDEARTTKGGDGSCAGHAWLRVRTSQGWTVWEDNRESEAEYPSSKILESQHKGCADCTPISLYP